MILYDTVGLNSPYISQELAIEIEQSCIRREGIDLGTGEVLYQITTGQLKGSFDYSIRINVRRYKWDKEPVSRAINEKAPTRLNTEPYVYLECSVHKAMCGHNVYGGPTDFKASVSYVIDLVSQLLDVALPRWEFWEVVRCDVSECYRLDSFEVVENWFRGVQAAVYPRREVDKRGLHSIASYGVSTAIKFYHKGPEFWKHDRKRLKKYMDSSKIDELQQMANCIIRVEVEVKARKFKYDFGRLLRVCEIEDSYFNRVHDVEVERFLKEGMNEMNRVRTHEGVYERLNSFYTARQANVLIAFWSQLSIYGEQVVRKQMPKATFQRKRKLLKDVGVSWLGTDVMVLGLDDVSEQFHPMRDSKFRVVELDNCVAEKQVYYSSIRKIS